MKNDHSRMTAAGGRSEGISFQAKHKELMEAVKKGDMKKTIEMIAWFKAAKF